ncbi:hypothetical protein D9M69_617560 [compost metagenome]
MMSGRFASSGRRKPSAVVSRITPCTVSPASARARKLEHTPSKVPLPDIAGALTTPTVTLQRPGVIVGDEEIE